MAKFLYIETVMNISRRPWLILKGTTARLAASRRGVTAVEFALIMPVILIVLLGIIEFGSIMFVRHVMFFAAREGARSYVTGVSTTTAEAVTLAENLLVSGNAKGTFTVSATTSGLGTSSAYITIDISTPMEEAALIDAISNVALAGRTLSASATMYVEQTSTNNTSCGKKKGSCSAKKTASKTKKVGS